MWRKVCIDKKSTLNEADTAPLATPVNRRNRRNLATWYLFLIPIIIVLSVVELYPLLYAVYLSLVGAGKGSAFTSANYASMLANRDFWNSVVVSLSYATLSTALAIGIGLALTFLVTQAKRKRGLLEAIFILPLAVSPIVVGVLWSPSSIWDDVQSFIHFVLGLPYIDELNTLFYFPVMGLSDAWEWSPLMMLVSLSIINSIPKAVSDAARVHGASRWQVFRMVVVPTVLTSPVMHFVLVLRFIDAMRAFEVPLVWSGWVGSASSIGSPVDSLSLYLFKLMFIPTYGFPIGLISAVAVAFLVATLLSTTVLNRLYAVVSRR